MSGVLGSNDPNTILDPTRIRWSRFCIVPYVSARTPFVFGLRYVLCFLRTPDFPVTFSRDFVDICFMFPFHYSLCFPRVHYVSFLHFLGLRSFPSTLFYCTLLIVLRSCSHIPLRRIRSLVYIPPVLVATTSELILLNSPLIFVWGSSERSDPPARLRPSFVSSALDLVPSGTRSGVGSR